ncbi:MAG: pilus assembly protein [Alphaproteobacteria bacterium]|nr:pilus assembly protein [Alphaproteobacteria bacterium]
MLLLPRTMLFLSRFKRAKSGATVIEFAMVAMPFFLLLYAIFDVALIFFASTTLENGLVAAARQIRTGEAQAANMSAAQFRTLVCNQISMLLGCDARLGLDVRKYSGFGNVQFPAALDDSGNMTGNLSFDPGAPGDVVVVRAFYTWPMLTPTVGTQFVNMAGGHRLLEATIAFRNEPFNGPIAN